MRERERDQLTDMMDRDTRTEKFGVAGDPYLQHTPGTHWAATDDDISNCQAPRSRPMRRAIC